MTATSTFTQLLKSERPRVQCCFTSTEAVKKKKKKTMAGLLGTSTAETVKAVRDGRLDFHTAPEV